MDRDKKEDSTAANNSMENLTIDNSLGTLQVR